MPLFSKVIARPGTYEAGSPLGRTRKKITPQDIHHYAKQFSAMKKAGLRIPFPVTHYLEQEVNGVKQLCIPGPETFKNNAKDNLGYWEQMHIDKTTGELHAIVDVPLAEDAARIGKTMAEVSPVITDYIDGNGRKWENCIQHIAAVMHPVIPGQDNFKPVPAESDLAKVAAFSIPMSAFIFSSEDPPKDDPPKPSPESEQPTGDPNANTNPDTNGDGAVDKNEQLQQALVTLKETLGLELPPDTTVENFIDRLITAAHAIQSRANINGTVETPPEESVTEEGVTMSTVTAPKPIDPAVKAAIDAQTALFSAQLNALNTFSAESRKAEYKHRIENLIASGRCDKASADANLMPLLNSYAFSLDSAGKPVEHPIDATLRTLEAMKPTKVATPFGAFSVSAPAGSQTVENPEGMSPEDEAKAEEAVFAEFEKNNGRPVRK